MTLSYKSTVHSPQSTVAGRLLWTVDRRLWTNTAMFSEELLERLRCPACRVALAFRQDKQDFRCDGCKRVYPIRDGVPVLLVDEASRED